MLDLEILSNLETCQYLTVILEFKDFIKLCGYHWFK